MNNTVDLDAILDEVDRFLAAARNRPRCVRILDALMQVVHLGRDHLLAWEACRAVVLGDAFLADLAPAFFVITGVAHIETAALHAAKLVDQQPNSLNVSYLLNAIAEDRRRAYLHNDWPNVSRAVKSGRHRLTALQPVIDRVKRKRDRELAHIDRRDIDSRWDRESIEVDQLQSIFGAVDEIAQELVVSSNVFSAAVRPSLPPTDAAFGPPSLTDLLYFASSAFRDETVISPNENIENMRRLEREFRKARQESLEIDEPTMETSKAG
ncbi:MAG TPA: hypothetical protein VN380_02195 [Thermoanaerobaculia bacterium]|jgi:hypothetical protein|nr:hypothetical protein [Thermoanaerobaculia bacterium]